MNDGNCAEQGRRQTLSAKKNTAEAVEAEKWSRIGEFREGGVVGTQVSKTQVRLDNKAGTRFFYNLSPR